MGSGGVYLRPIHLHTSAKTTQAQLLALPPCVPYTSSLSFVLLILLWTTKEHPPWAALSSSHVWPACSAFFCTWARDGPLGSPLICVHFHSASPICSVLGECGISHTFGTTLPRTPRGQLRFQLHLRGSRDTVGGHKDIFIHAPSMHTCSKEDLSQKVVEQTSQLQAEDTCTMGRHNPQRSRKRAECTVSGAGAGLSTS